jgi:hypothetical protein
VPTPLLTFVEELFVTGRVRLTTDESPNEADITEAVGKVVEFEKAQRSICPGLLPRWIKRSCVGHWLLSTTPASFRFTGILVFPASANDLLPSFCADRQGPLLGRSRLSVSSGLSEACAKRLPGRSAAGNSDGLVRGLDAFLGRS